VPEGLDLVRVPRGPPWIPVPEEMAPEDCCLRGADLEEHPLSASTTEEIMRESAAPVKTNS
jgi:hypothetical protein